MCVYESAYIRNHFLLAASRSYRIGMATPVCLTLLDFARLQNLAGMEFELSLTSSHQTTQTGFWSTHPVISISFAPQACCAILLTHLHIRHTHDAVVSSSFFAKNYDVNRLTLANAQVVLVINANSRSAHQIWVCFEWVRLIEEQKPPPNNVAFTFYLKYLRSTPAFFCMRHKQTCVSAFMIWSGLLLKCRALRVHSMRMFALKARENIGWIRNIIE